MHSPLRVFIGFDSREPVAFHVAAHSLLKHASKPVSIVPLGQAHLRSIGIYQRPRAASEATEFSLTRFLVPYLSGYKGLSLFVDCDVLFQADVYDLLLFPLIEAGKEVYVCQHDYQPKSATKFLGQQQTAYPRKNWSSVMLFDNARCFALTPDYVNGATPMDLHRFAWLNPPQCGDPTCNGHHGLNNPGSLPLEWNWLVGEYEPNANAKLLHFTQGTPCFEGYRTCDHADLWFQALGELGKPWSAA